VMLIPLWVLVSSWLQSKRLPPPLLPADDAARRQKSRVGRGGSTTDGSLSGRGRKEPAGGVGHSSTNSISAPRRVAA